MISSYADVTGNHHLTSIGDAGRTAPSPVSGCLQRNRRLLTWPAERDRTVAACYTRFAHRPHDQSCEEQENGMTLRTTGVERYRTDVPLAGGRFASGNTPGTAQNVSRGRWPSRLSLATPIYDRADRGSPARP